MSNLGDHLSVRHVGVTIFGNQERKVDVSTWNVDSQIAASAERKLIKAGFKIVKASPEAARDIGKASFQPFTSSYSFSGGSDGVKRAANASGADMIILLLEAPKVVSDPFFRTNQYVSGYGVYQRRSIGNVKSVNYAQISAVILDGRSGEVIAKRFEWSSTPRPESLQFDENSLPTTIADLKQPPELFFPVIEQAVGLALSKLHLAD